MEAQLIVEGIGSWKNFEELENALVLDELLMLHEAMAKSKHTNFRMLASLQGVDIPDVSQNESDEELPPEILEHERAWKAKKEAMQQSGEAAELELDSFGLGYKRV